MKILIYRKELSMQKLLDSLNSRIAGPGLAFAVLACGIFLCLYLKPFVLLHPVASFRALFGSDGQSEHGGMTPLHAMLVALAGTLGVGNIAGVASAIYIGGAGAVFWMWVSALAAMPIKYAEIVLAVGHRRTQSNGANTLRGGAHYYISDLGRTKAGKRVSAFAAALFSVLCLSASLTIGSAVQSNAVAAALGQLANLSPLLCGILLAVPTYIAISGGMKRISAVCVRLIPAMSLVYIAMSLYVITVNSGLLGEIFDLIVNSAFDFDAARGGIFGFVTSRAISVGVTRGIVSNEAGCGTAPMAHANANVEYPARQGLWGMVEVAIDTLVICTMTALVVLIAQAKGVIPTGDGMRDALDSFGQFIPHADLPITIAIIVFVFCTLLCWYYYGSESLAYLTKHDKRGWLYPVIFTLSCIAGALYGGIVWSLADLSISLMTIVNLAAIFANLPEIKRETERFFTKDKRRASDK